MTRLWVVSVETVLKESSTGKQNLLIITVHMT